MGIRRITCVQCSGEFPDFCFRLVMPDYGMPLIGTILSEAGYDVTVQVENIKPPQWDPIAKSDLVCFSSLNAGARKTYELAEKVRSGLGIPTIIGGTHASYFPESCLRHCDYVVLGEGDVTILELVDTLSRGGDPGRVAGIAYRIGDRIQFTPPRASPASFDTIPDYSLIEGYRRMNLSSMVWQRRKPLLTMQSSRGCRHGCTFCIVNTMFPGGYRKRGIESVIRDLRDKRRYGRDLMFVDNEFAAMRSHTKRLLRRMIEEDFGYNIVVFTRVESARDDELLSLMRRAGVNYIYQGYESIQPETLVAYKKGQSLEHIVSSIRKLHSFGFGILGSFVVGADTDTLQTMRLTADFVMEHNLVNAYFFPIWGHFPERSNGYRTIIPWYRSIFKGWGYCDGHYVTHFPKLMRPSQFQRAIADGYRTIYSVSEMLRALRTGGYEAAKKKALLRYSWSFVEKNVNEYVPFLEELEEGLYDEEGRLMEELLVERVGNDPRWTFQAGNLTMKALGLSPPDLPVCGKHDITSIHPLLVDPAIATCHKGSL